MNFITKEELEKKDIISKFSINNGNLVLSEDCEYKSTFDVGDIVTYKDNTDRIGVIYFIEDDEFSINWNNGTESTETSSKMCIRDRGYYGQSRVDFRRRWYERNLYCWCFRFLYR